MDIQIKELLKMGVLEPAPLNRGFLSQMFLVQKNDGTQRPVINLKALNDFVREKKFSLISHFKVPDFLQPGDYMTKVDLAHAYFHIPVAKTHRRFLRIVYRGQCLQMTCLPQGLSSSPQIFAAITNWIAEILRKKGIRVIVYLDDFLLAHQNRETLRLQTLVALDFLQSLGWTINVKKCVPPTDTGDTISGSVMEHLPQSEDANWEQVPGNMEVVAKPYDKEEQSILGQLNFAAFVVPRGRLHCRQMQLQSIAMAKLPPRKKVPVNLAVLNDLEWWRHNVSTHSLIHFPKACHFIATDAADSGWGHRWTTLHSQAVGHNNKPNGTAT